jgi:chromosome segregation ATPase/DNA-binding transcriptional ArsR family regulator
MASEQKDIFRIDNIKLLKVISDPIRKQIIDVLYDEPLTASEIADEISFPKDKIYYHIKKLQSSGILIIAESEKVKGITQNKFINVAEKFEIDESLLGDQPSPLIKKSSTKTIEKKLDENSDAESIQDDVDETESTKSDDNPLLASLLKAKGKPAGQIPDSFSTTGQGQIDEGTPPPQSGDGPVRIIADRRRGGDRRATLEQRVGKERRLRQKRNFEGGEKREGKERRKGIEKRVLSDRRKAIDRRLEAEKKKKKSLESAAPIKRYKPKKQSARILESVKMNLNGLNEAMTFIHTGDNVTFLQATRKLDTFEIQQTKIYDLPYQYNGHAIKTLPDLIKHVYANYVDPKKTRSHYLAMYSTRYNYEMTFVATPEGGAKKDFKDYLYYNLTKSYNLKLEESIVDWSFNDKYENNAVVCYSALGATIQNDYTNLTAAGIQPRYSTAFPKILHNIYSYGAGTTGSGNALIIYIDERRTNLALVQNQQLVESRYFWIGVRDFYLPLCKMFKVGRKVIDVDRKLAEDFLLNYGIEMDESIIDTGESIPWIDAQQLLGTPVAKFSKELDNSMKYFSDVRSTISNKMLEIDNVYLGGPGSHIKNISTIAQRTVGKAVEDIDGLYADLFKAMNVTKQQKKLLKNRDSMLQDRERITSSINRSRDDVIQLDKMIRAFKDPEAIAVEIDKQMRNKQTYFKDIAVANNALETNTQDINHLTTEYNNEEKKTRADLEKADKDLKKQQSKAMPIYTEVDLIEKKVEKLNAPINAKKKKSAVIEKKLRMKLKDVSREKKLEQQELRKLKDSISLCESRIKDMEKDIEHHIEEQDETTGDLNFQFSQRDEYEIKPRKRQVVFKKQQREIDQKEFELRKQKKKTIIDMKVDAGTIQDLSKRLGIINERIEAVNHELNDAEFEFESCSSDLQENLSAIDKNEADLRTAVSDYEKTRLEHDATLRFIRKKIDKLDNKVNKIIEAYEQAQGKEEEHEAENAATELSVKYQIQSFKNEIGKMSSSRDKIVTSKNKQESVIKSDEKNIKHNNKKLSSLNKDQDSLDNEIEILEADQTTATVTIDALSLSINDRKQEIEKIQKIYFFELETANKVIASANWRLPDFRRKLPTSVSETESLADRFNNVSLQEQDERIIYANINESINRVNEMTPKLVLIKEHVGELIALDGELLALEKDQKSKETTINNIDDKIEKLHKKLSDLSAKIETLSKDIKDREIRHKIERDSLVLTQKRLTKGETDLERSQEHYSGLKEIKDKAIKDRDENIAGLEKQLEELNNQYENLRDLQKEHKETLNELLNIRKSIANQKARINNIEKEESEQENGYSRLSTLLTSQIDQLNNSSERIESDNRELELQIVLERTRISELKPEINEWTKEKRSLQKELDLISKQKISYAETTNKNKVETKEKLSTELANNAQDIFNHKEQCEKNSSGYRHELNEKLEKFIIQEMELKQRLGDRQDKLIALNKKRNQAQGELNKIKKSAKPKLANFEKEIVSLDKQLVSLESKISLKHKELVSLRDDKQSIQEQLSKIDSSMSSSKKDIVFNSDEIPQLEEEIREQKLKLAGFYDVPTYEANALKEEIRKLETKLQATRTSILISKDSIQLSGDTVKKQKKAVADAGVAIRNLENEERSLTRKHRQMKKDHRRAINKMTDLENHIDQLDRHYRQAERELNESDLSFIRSQETVESRLTEISTRKERSKEQCLDNIKKQDIALEQTLEQLAQKEKTIKNIHKEKIIDLSKNLKEALSKLTERAKQIDGKLNQGEKQNEAIITEISNVEARVEGTTDTAKTNREKVRHNNREIQKLEIKSSEEKRAFNNRAKSFEMDLGQQDKKLSTLQEQLESADKDVTVIEARISDTQKNIPGGKPGIYKLKERLNKLREKNKIERNSLNEKDTQFSSKHSLLNDQIIELTIQKEKQEQNISDLEQDMTDFVTKMAIHTEEHQNGEDQRISLEDQLHTEQAVLDEILMTMRRIKKNYTNQRRHYKNLNKAVQKLFTVIGEKNKKIDNSIVLKTKDIIGINHELSLVEEQLDKRELTRSYNFAPFNKTQKHLQISHGELVNDKDKMSQLLGTDQDNLKRLARLLEQEKAFNKQINTLEKSVEKFDQDKNQHVDILKNIDARLREKNKQLLKITVEKQALIKTVDAFEVKIKDEQVQLDLTLESLYTMEHDISTCEKAHHKEMQQLEKKLTSGQIRLKNLRTKMIIMEKETDQMSREMELLETQRRIEKKALHDNDELFKMTRNSLTEEKEILKEHNQDFEKKLEVSKARVEEVNKRLNPVMAEHSLLIESLEQTRTGERDKQKKINLFEQMIYDNKRRIEEMAIEFENDQEKYKEKLNTITENIGGLKEKVTSLKDYIKLQRYDIAQAEKELKDLQKQYDSKEIDIEKLKMKIDDAESSVKNERELIKKVVEQSEKSLLELKTRELEISEQLRIEEDKVEAMQEIYSAIQLMMAEKEDEYLKEKFRLEEIQLSIKDELVGKEAAIKQAEIMIKEMNQTLIAGPKKIEKFDKKLNIAQEKLEGSRGKLKDNQHAVKIMNKDLSNVQEFFVEEKGIGKDPMRSNYMANIGLLLDAQAKLNILPDEHRENYKFLPPARFLQSAMLVLLVLFSLFTFSNTRTLGPLKILLPQKKEQMARLNIQREIFNDYMFDLSVIKGFKQLKNADRVMTNNVLGALKFLSRTMPDPIEITNLSLIKETNTENLLNQLYDQGFVSSEMEEMSENIKNTMFTLRLDGFLEVNKLQATTILERTKIILEGNGNIQAAFLFQSDDSSKDKTTFNLIIII